MGAFRITKIRCPSCEGTGECKMLGFTCQWCGGSKRMTPVKAERWANTIYALSHGGYICGDLDLADLREGEAKAEAAYQLIGKVPAWRRTTPDAIRAGAEGRA